MYQPNIIIMSHKKSNRKKSVTKKPDTGASLAARSSSVSFTAVIELANEVLSNNGAATTGV